MEDATKARDVALGPKKDRLRAPVDKRRKPLVNGVAFKQDSHVTPVKPNTRCYTLRPTQQPNGLICPNSGSKVVGDELDDYGIMRKNIVSASRASTFLIASTVLNIYTVYCWMRYVQF